MDYCCNNNKYIENHRRKKISNNNCCKPNNNCCKPNNEIYINFADNRLSESKKPNENRYQNNEIARLLQQRQDDQQRDFSRLQAQKETELKQLQQIILEKDREVKQVEQLRQEQQRLREEQANSNRAEGQPVSHQSLSVEGQPRIAPPEQNEENHDAITQMECVVCRNVKKSILFFPCKHMMACQACAPLCQTCPVCRDNIVDRVQVFI